MARVESEPFVVASELAPRRAAQPPRLWNDLSREMI